jgi:hypothetical protein
MTIAWAIVIATVAYLIDKHHKWGAVRKWAKWGVSVALVAALGFVAWH